MPSDKERKRYLDFFTQGTDSVGRDLMEKLKTCHHPGGTPTRRHNCVEWVGGQQSGGTQFVINFYRFSMCNPVGMEFGEAELRSRLNDLVNHQDHQDANQEQCLKRVNGQLDTFELNRDFNR